MCPKIKSTQCVWRASRYASPFWRQPYAVTMWTLVFANCTAMKHWRTCWTWRPNSFSRYLKPIWWWVYSPQETCGAVKFNPVILDVLSFQVYPKLSQSYFLLLECLAQDHMTFLSTLDPAIFLYIIKSISEGLAAEGMTNLTTSDAAGEFMWQF